MNLKPIEKVKTQEEARQIAIDWQNFPNEYSPSIGEMMYDYLYFEALAEKFDLREEFEENGII